MKSNLLIILFVLCSAVCSAQQKGKHYPSKVDTTKQKWYVREPDYQPRSSFSVSKEWWWPDSSNFVFKQCSIELTIDGVYTMPFHCVLRNDTLRMMLDTSFYPLFREAKVILVDSVRFKIDK